MKDEDLEKLAEKEGLAFGKDELKMYAWSNIHDSGDYYFVVLAYSLEGGRSILKQNIGYMHEDKDKSAKMLDYISKYDPDAITYARPEFFICMMK